MKRFLSLVFCCLPLLLAGQELNFWKVYHPHILEAERFLLQDNMYDALKGYEKGFATTEDGFAKDYFNAAVCSSYLGNANKVYDYLRKLASKGMSLDFIKNEVAFTGIQNDPDWRSFELEYLELKRNFDQSLNSDLTQTLKVLTNRDRFYRASETITEDSLNLIDTQNAIILDTLIKQYGFPAENQLGVGENGYPDIEPAFYEIIKRQNFENQSIDFTSILLEASRTGKILPHSAARLIAIINANDIYFSRHVYKIQVDSPLAFSHIPHAAKLNEWVYLKISGEDERQINELRLNNGMEPLEEYRKKVLFSLQEHRFLLPYKAFAGVWYVRDAQLANDYLEGAVLAKEASK